MEQRCERTVGNGGAQRRSRDDYASPTDSSQSPALEGRGGLRAASGRQVRHRRRKCGSEDGDWTGRGRDLA